MDELTNDKMVEHLLDLADDDGILCGWILTAKLAAPDRTTSVHTTCSENMDVVTHLGLAEFSKQTARERVIGEVEPE